MKGSYCLILNVKTDIEIDVGSLGLIKFQKGYYVYVGSALNNIEKRVERHKKKQKKLHWHIDYLTTNKNVEIVEAYYSFDKECELANFISSHGRPINGFGCTDCRCASHLFKIQNYNFIKKAMNKL